MVTTTKITCSDCGAILASTPDALGQPPAACHQCGSRRQNVNLEISEEVASEIHDLMDLKAKNANMTGKRKVRQHIIIGSEQRKSVGDYVNKERVIDKDKNLYREHITDKDGKIIHSVEESLTDHFGHGSAKTKAKSSDS